MNFFNKSAVFSDETEQFVSPINANAGDAVKFSIRVAREQKLSVVLMMDEVGHESYEMEKTSSDNLFDYYTAEVVLKKLPIRYYYKIEFLSDTFYYNKQGIRANLAPHYNFRFVPGLSIPDWARGAIMYQIFPDRFFNGDKINDVVRHEYAYLGKTAMFCEWGSDIAPSGDFCNFYGGDIQGIMDKMEYLSDLGIEVIYLNPVFVSPSSHKYDIQDYDHVDPHFGKIVSDGGSALSFEKINNVHATKYRKRTTEKDNLEASNKLFADFMDIAHKHGIKVILDGVFNHCGCYNKWMDVPGFYKDVDGGKGAYHAEDSPYHKYFLWHAGGKWPKNDHYDAWWANTNHPKLNFESSQELFDYMIGIGKKWVSPPYNVDGWRLDVAADLGLSPEMNHKFWRAFYDAVKQANPQTIVLAEHYGDPSAWLNAGEWDTIMNYDAFMEPITWFLTGVDKHSEKSIPSLKGNALAFEEAMRHNMALLNINALQSAMNQLSNHDHSRFLTRTSGATGRLHTVGPRAAEAGVNKDIMMEAVVFQMTWPGSPCVYYGDEAGLMGWTDPDNRRTFPWGKEDKTLLGLHKALIAMRKKLPVLKYGSVDFLWTNQDFLSFGRWDNNAKAVVLINNSKNSVDVVVPVWKLGITHGYLTCLISTGKGAFAETNEQAYVSLGELRVTVEGQSSMVFYGQFE